MKRFTVINAVLLVLSLIVNLTGISLREALATVPTKPYTFVGHTLAQSSQVNDDFDPLYSTLNANLDSSNFSLARGLGANYIQAGCSGCTGTFSPGNYVFTPTSAAFVPLSVQLFASQTADAFDVKNSAGTVIAHVGADGSLYSAALGGSLPLCTTAGSVITTSGCSGYVSSVAATAPIVSSGGTTPNISCPNCAQLSPAAQQSGYLDPTSIQIGTPNTNGTSVINTSSGATNIGCIGASQNCAVNFYTQGTTSPSYAAITGGSGGCLSNSANSAGTRIGLACVTPMYQNSGANAGAGSRIVEDACTFSSASSCTVVFGKAWTSATTYTCRAGTPIAGAQALPVNGTTSQITFNFYNVNGTTYTGSGTIAWSCEGY